MKNLHEYFDYHSNQEPYPIIDHALRVNRLPDGSFHFYIHPANTNGITVDLVVTPESIKVLHQPEEES
jgi:hypothetical protein